MINVLNNSIDILISKKVNRNSILASINRYLSIGLYILGFFLILSFLPIQDVGIANGFFHNPSLDIFQYWYFLVVLISFFLLFLIIEKLNLKEVEGTLTLNEESIQLIFDNKSEQFRWSQIKVLELEGFDSIYIKLENESFFLKISSLNNFKELNIFLVKFSYKTKIIVKD